MVDAVLGKGNFRSEIPWKPSHAHNSAKPIPELTESQAEALASKLLALAAETTNLPPDIATYHDRYLHGLLK